MAVSVITAALLIRSVDRRSAVAHGVSEMSDGLVILEPEQWVGQKLPIAQFVDADLSSGECTVVLHQHDCPACQEAVRRYEQLASKGERVALVEVPPYGLSHSPESACRNCRLKDDHEWFAQTPVEIRLQDGVVTAVKAEVH